MTQRLGPSPLWDRYVPAMGWANATPLQILRVILPSWRGAELGGSLAGQSTALPHQGRPSACPQDSSPGPGVLTALCCALVRAVPAVVGAVAETTLCHAEITVAAALLCPAELLPDLWGGGTHVSEWLVPQGHREHSQIVPWGGSRDRFSLPTSCSGQGTVPQDTANTGRAPLPFAPHPVPPRSQLTSQQMWDSLGKPQFLNMMSSSATCAPQVGGCVREKMSCYGRMGMA